MKSIIDDDAVHQCSYQQQLRDLEAQHIETIKSKHATIKQLQGTNKTLSDEVDKLEDREDELEDLQAQQTGSIKVKHATIKQLQGTNKTLLDKLDKLKSREDELEDREEYLENKLETMTRLMEISKAENYKLRHELAEEKAKKAVDGAAKTKLKKISEQLALMAGVAKESK
jgi:predicted RNase H-like nuclease (RuvC/YqgF family)